MAFFSTKQKISSKIEKVAKYVHDELWTFCEYFKLPILCHYQVTVNIKSWQFDVLLNSCDHNVCPFEMTLNKLKVEKFKTKVAYRVTTRTKTCVKLEPFKFGVNFGLKVDHKVNKKLNH